MATRRDIFGRGCFFCSLAALYCLLGMKLYVACREGMWFDWPLGDYLPDAVVRAVFALPDGGFRAVLTWLLRQDVMYHAAAVTIVLWLLLPSGRGDGGDGPSGDKPSDRAMEV